MSEEEDFLPEFKMSIQGESSAQPNDNFDASDVVWTGEDGELDTEKLLSEFGREPDSPLTALLRALISGHTPGATSNDMAKRLRQATAAKPEKKSSAVDHSKTTTVPCWKLPGDTRRHVTRFH